MIRVGRIKYDPYPKSIKPNFEDFKIIEVMAKSSAYGELSPYCLTDDNGIILENKWQFGKAYKEVPNIRIPKNYYDKTIVWEWKKEIHFVENDDEYDIKDEYWNWREKGFKCKYPIRYPVGKNRSHTCIGYLYEENDEWELLDYIDARKKVYVPEYLNSVKKQPTFQKLKNMLQQGINLLIIEVDGPHQESLDYYKNKYGVDDSFIENDTMLATDDNLDIMLNDDSHPYGHGFCLAQALLD